MQVSWVEIQVLDDPLEGQYLFEILLTLPTMKTN